MKNIIVTLFFCLILFSCSSQIEAETEINGNWFRVYDPAVENYYYAEIFFDEEKFYIYNEIGGLARVITYNIENDTVYGISLDGKERESIGLLSKIDSTTIYLNNKNNSMTLKKISDGVTLEDYITNGNEDYISDFMKRAEVWNENKK